MEGARGRVDSTQLTCLPMTRSLFRPEALAFQTQYREFGQVGRFQATSLKALSWLLIITVGLLIAFVFTASYTRKETVSGYLAPATGSAEMFVPQQGTVTAVYVSQDQVVKQGDVLLTIDTSQITADGIDVNATILKSLSAQKILLTSQLEAENRTARGEKERLTAAIRSGEAELAQLSSQMGFQQEQIEIGQKLVDSAKKMNAAGYFSKPELYKRQEALLEARQTLSSLKQRYTARETELAQTRSSLQQLPTEFGSKAPTPSERIGADRATDRRNRRPPRFRHPCTDCGSHRQHPGDCWADCRPQAAAACDHAAREPTPGRAIRAHAGGRIRATRPEGQASIRRFPVSAFWHLFRTGRQHL